MRKILRKIEEKKEKIRVNEKKEQAPRKQRRSDPFLTPPENRKQGQATRN